MKIERVKDYDIIDNIAKSINRKIPLGCWYYPISLTDPSKLNKNLICKRTKHLNYQNLDNNMYAFWSNKQCLYMRRFYAKKVSFIKYCLLELNFIYEKLNSNIWKNWY